MIVTFYSFKGGVGRSMAVANIGAWLYQQGRRVLLVDWDLEAPGLEAFFVPPAERDSIRGRPGLVDLVASYRQLWALSSAGKRQDNASHESSPTKTIGTIRHMFQALADTSENAISTKIPGLWLLHAGCRTGVSEAFYRQSVHELDWGRFYGEYDGYYFIEWLRREMEKDVDFVLLDSRTGETEMGGVCTQHLADVVVVMFAPNDSNLEGAKRIAELLQTDRVKQLRGPSRPLMVLPIPSRVDTQGETGHFARFERKFRDTFEKLSYKSMDWCWESQIRYVTTYSYEESNVMLANEGHRDLRQAYARIGEEILQLREERLSPKDREYQARARSTTRLGAREGTERAQSTIQQLISTARAKIDSGDFKTASSLLSSAVTLATQDLGEEHPDTLSTMNNLAAVLYAQGILPGARQLNEQILQVRLRTLGQDDPDTLASMNNLAETLRAQGDLAGARKLLEQTLEIQHRMLGPEHPDTLASMSNLAWTLRVQGDWAGARKLLEQTLETQQRTLGPQHPDTLASMNNLAETLRAQGDLAGARKLLEQTLDIQRRMLGLEHPATLTSMNSLALTLRAQGDLAEARKLLEQTLDIRRRVLGPEHPATLASMNNLAEML